jgi:3-oxoacyl-[acyl-carrier protein] reductase
MRLIGKTAIVTGGADGIGKGIVERFAAEGASVVIGDIDPQVGQATADEIDADAPGKIGFVKLDVTKRDEIFHLVESTQQEFGRVDILVNNAGICSLTGIEEMTEPEWDTMLNINLRGVFFCSQAVTPIMKRQKAGTILNMASLAGKVGGVVVGAHYAASKAGVICLTKSFAKALAPYGVRVNAISPGPIETAMTAEWSAEMRTNFAKQTPLGRIAQTEDISEAALFLVADGARHITGEILDVNGGLIMD